MVDITKYNTSTGTGTQTMDRNVLEKWRSIKWHRLTASRLATVQLSSVLTKILKLCDMQIMKIDPRIDSKKKYLVLR